MKILLIGIFAIFMFLAGLASDFILFPDVPESNNFQIIGFQPYWLMSKAAKVYDGIDTITYFGLTINSDGSIKKLNNPQEEEPGWTNLKNTNFANNTTSLLLHLSDDDEINKLLEKPEKNAVKLMSDVTPIMKSKKFSNLNLDIESFRESSASAQIKFTRFVKEVKKVVQKENLGTLTVEIPPIALFKKNLINPIEIGKIADFVILMAYDYSYAGSFVTGPVAPYGGAFKTREFDVRTTVSEAVKKIPSEKIILGMPLYGYEWETLDNIAGSAVIPGSGAVASSRRISTMLADEKYKPFNDKEASSPYIIFSDTKNKNYFHQIYYENEESILEKITLAKNQKLAGVAFWALGYEDNKILQDLKIH